MKDIVIEQYYYDFVVIGGGLAGMATAISAARNGSKVALINNRSLLGGNASSEIGIDINGACYNSRYSPSVYARETGIIEEIKQEIFHRAGYEDIKSASYDGVFFDVINREKNIDLYLNTQAIDVFCRNSVIKHVDCVQLTTEKKIRFCAPLFADCTGDGFVGARAGADYDEGSEGKDEFGESLAPKQRTKFVNGSTLMFKTIRTGKPEKYIAPDFAYDITKLDFFKDLGTKNRTFYRGKDGNFQGLWWVEFRGNLDIIKDSEIITEELRKLVYGIWNYIKNSGKFENVDDAKLVWVGSVLGKRESRRFLGEYILNQRDIISKKQFDDACYCAGWPMDVHANYGIYDVDYATHWNFVPGMYNVPFSTLYSRNINNLLFAGRLTSCTRVANGSTRVMATCAVGGQAAGTAAALCKKYRCTPRQIRLEHICELQELLLRQDQTIVGYKEKPFIENITVKTSSRKLADNGRKESMVELERDIALCIPLSSKSLDSVDIYVKNSGGQTILNYDILWGDYPECYLPSTKQKSLSVRIGENYEGYATLPIDCGAGADGKIYIDFRSNATLSIGTTSRSLVGISSLQCTMREPDERDPRSYSTVRLKDNICFRDLSPEQELFCGENVFCGYGRPYGAPNCWVSEGKGNQWLTATFDSAYVSEIHLVFDTDLREDIIMNQPLSTIKKYRLTVEGKNVSKRFEITDNFRRINKFFIGDEIEKITFVPEENYGDENFTLFAIKVYKD